MLTLLVCRARPRYLCGFHATSFVLCRPCHCPPHRDTFLRSLAAAQWDKKRKSKHLSEAKQPLSDEIRTQDLPPAEEGEGPPPEDLSGRAAGVGKQAMDQ